MKMSRLTLTFALMISSIVLLLALQVFWLRSSYEKAFIDLRKETSTTFRNTVFALRDTFFMNHMEPLATTAAKPDSATRLFFAQRSDSITWQQQGIKKNTFQVKEHANNIQIYLSSTSNIDSINALVRPLISRVHEGQLQGGSSFILRVNLDSLNTDTLSHHIMKALANTGITTRFKINHFRTAGPGILPSSLDAELSKNTEEDTEAMASSGVYGNKLISEWVRFDPIHRYSVTIFEIRGILLKQITPQILFSVFVTLLTIAAFFFMYRSMRAQQKLMELKNDFISNITHELKTPVTTVSVALEALKNFRGLENPKLTEEYLEIAQSELNRLAILTDKILKTATFENKGVSFQPEPVDLEKLITQILGSMKLLFEKHRAKVTFEKRGENFVVTGGGIHLTNVIYNLLDNALKYSPNEPRIEVTLKNDDNKIELLVKDHGIGIPTEFRKKIFEKFFRVPTGDVHNTKGYGLGLSYVDTVIKSHRGTIEVESGNGAGSLFRIVLPK